MIQSALDVDLAHAPLPLTTHTGSILHSSHSAFLKLNFTNIYSFINSCIHSFIHSLIHFFIHFFIHSVIHSIQQTDQGVLIYAIIFRVILVFLTRWGFGGGVYSKLHWWMFNGKFIMAWDRQHMPVDRLSYPVGEWL